MDLSVNEKSILMLHKYLLNKEYTPSKNKMGHIMIQSMANLCQFMWVKMYGEYSFVWSSLGPSSSRLEEDLRALDSKKKDIKRFYADPDISFESLWGGVYLKQLEILKYIISQNENENFINYLSCLLYIYETVCVKYRDGAFKELQSRWINYDIDFNDISIMDDCWTYLIIMEQFNYPQPVDKSECIQVLNREIIKYRRRTK